MTTAAPEAPQPAKLVDHLRLAERLEAMHAKGHVWITTIAAAYMARMAATEEPQPAKREPLTDEEIMERARGECQDMRWPSSAIYIARAIERAHGIGGQP